MFRAFHPCVLPRISGPADRPDSSDLSTSKTRPSQAWSLIFQAVVLTIRISRPSHSHHVVAGPASAKAPLRFRDYLPASEQRIYGALAQGSEHEDNREGDITPLRLSDSNLSVQMITWSRMPLGSNPKPFLPKSSSPTRQATSRRR